MGTVRTFESNEERLADQWGYKEDFALEINEGSDGGYSYPDEMHHVILSDGECVFIGTMRVVLERES